MVVVCWLAFVSTSFFEFAALLRVIACINIDDPFGNDKAHVFTNVLRQKLIVFVF